MCRRRTRREVRQREGNEGDFLHPLDLGDETSINLFQRRKNGLRRHIECKLTDGAVIVRFGILLFRMCRIVAPMVIHQKQVGRLHQDNSYEDSQQKICCYLLPAIHSNLKQLMTQR